MVGIGFFAPFPLALMVPFMAGQSLAMGEAFGKGFQYGKRKISSMSNEEFNALDFKKLSESIHTDYKVMIPSLVQSIADSKVLQDAVFKALGDVILQIPKAILDFFGDVSQGATGTTQTQFKEGDSRTFNTFGRLREKTRFNSQGQEDVNGLFNYLGELFDPFNPSQFKSKQQKDDEAFRAQQQRDRESKARRDSEERRREAQETREAHEREQERQRGVGSSTKRKAGRSQIAERNKLIREIQGKIRRRAGMSGGSQFAAQRAKLLREAQAFQSALTRLLSRYRF